MMYNTHVNAGLAAGLFALTVDRGRPSADSAAFLITKDISKTTVSYALIQPVAAIAAQVGNVPSVVLLTGPHAPRILKRLKRAQRLWGRRLLVTARVRRHLDIASLDYAHRTWFTMGQHVYVVDTLELIEAFGWRAAGAALATQVARLWHRIFKSSATDTDWWPDAGAQLLSSREAMHIAIYAYVQACGKELDPRPTVSIIAPRPHTLATIISPLLPEGILEVIGAIADCHQELFYLPGPGLHEVMEQLKEKVAQGTTIIGDMTCRRREPLSVGQVPHDWRITNKHAAIAVAFRGDLSRPRNFTPTSSKRSAGSPGSTESRAGRVVAH